MLNRVGQRIDPCGTSDNSNLNERHGLFILTSCILYLRWEHINVITSLDNQ